MNKKKELGKKLGTLYKRNWSLFLFSILIAFVGIFFFQTYKLILCVIGMMFFSTGLYFLFDLLFTRIVVYQNGFCVKQFLHFPKTSILYSEVDQLEEEKRKRNVLWHLKFRTYYHFMHKPYDTLFTVSKNEYFHVPFLLDKIGNVSVNNQ